MLLIQNKNWMKKKRIGLTAIKHTMRDIILTEETYLNGIKKDSHNYVKAIIYIKYK